MNLKDNRIIISAVVSKWRSSMIHFARSLDRIDPEMIDFAATCGFKLHADNVDFSGLRKGPPWWQLRAPFADCIRKYPRNLQQDLLNGPPKPEYLIARSQLPYPIQFLMECITLVISTSWLPSPKKNSPMSQITSWLGD